MIGQRPDDGGGVAPGHGWSDDPERTLADRLGRGEIDTEEYERCLEALRHTDCPAHT